MNKQSCRRHLRTECQFFVIFGRFAVVFSYLLLIFLSCKVVVNAQSDIDSANEPFPHEYDKDTICTRSFCDAYWDTGGAVCRSESNWGVVYDLNDQLNCTLDVGFTSVFCKESCCPVKSDGTTTQQKFIMLGIAVGIIVVMAFCNFLMYKYKDKPIRLNLPRKPSHNDTNNDRSSDHFYDEECRDEQQQRGQMQQTSSWSSHHQKPSVTDVTTSATTTAPSPSPPLPLSVEDRGIRSSAQQQLYQQNTSFNSDNNNGIHNDVDNVMDATTSTSSQDHPEFYEDEENSTSWASHR
mmetsp:Transcript_11315/g.17503  ORF Transcript_11315/g.17503 Transcript_11315/m.17503 type:complete len:294 (+) Transcript_11315:210-1091(+)